MKHLTQLVLIIFAFGTFSCDKHMDPCCPIGNNAINLKVQDREGNDLLDQKRAKSFRENVIKIFYERAGELEEYFNGGHSNMRRNFWIISPHVDEKYHQMRLIIDSEVTVIQWNEHEADTLYSEIVYDKEFNQKHIQKVFHKGELKYSNDPSHIKAGFIITKER